MNNREFNIAYRSDIDGLRSVAVLAVVFYHAFPQYLPGGFIGVDIFFVISGFLISSIIFNDMQKERFSLRYFYMKRIKRIFPSLILFLIFFLFVGYFIFFDKEFKNFSKHIMASTIFINNFLLLREANYFDKLSELKPLLHLWSLGIEEQFYLFWPFLLMTIKRTNKAKLYLVFLILSSFIFNLFEVKNHSIACFYLPFTRMWELGFGGLLSYFAYEKKTGASYINYRIQKQSLDYISFLFLLVLVVSLFKFNQSLLYPSWYALVPVLIAGFFIYFPSWVNHKILSNRMMVMIGLISYPLYLWHWGFLSFAKIVLGSNISNFIVCILVLSSFLFAYFTFIFVETPIRKNKLLTDTKIVFYLLLTMFLLFLLSFIVYKKNGLPQRKINHISKMMISDIQNFDSYKKMNHPCDYLPFLKNYSVCLQSQKTTPEFAIWGDSHAEHLFPGVSRLDKKHSWVLIEKSGCPPLLNIKAFWKGERDTCQAFNSSVFNLLNEKKSIQTVYLSFMGLFYMGESYSIEHRGKYSPNNFNLILDEHSNFSKYKTFIYSLTQTVDSLIKIGKKVIIVNDIPALPFLPEQCMDRKIKWVSGNACVLNANDIAITSQKKLSAIFEQIKKQHPEVEIIDLKKIFCDKHRCHFVTNQHLMLRDSHHLSLYGSDQVAPKLLEALDKISR